MGRSEGVGYLCFSFLSWEVKWLIIGSSVFNLLALLLAGPASLWKRAVGVFCVPDAVQTLIRYPRVQPECLICVSPICSKTHTHTRLKGSSHGSPEQIKQSETYFSFLGTSMCFHLQQVQYLKITKERGRWSAVHSERLMCLEATKSSGVLFQNGSVFLNKSLE